MYIFLDFFSMVLILLSAFLQLYGILSEGTNTYGMSDINCMGNETTLAECTQAPWGTKNCDNEEDVGLRCSPGKEHRHRYR